MAVRERIAARVQAEERQERKQRLIEMALREVYDHARRMIEEFDYEAEETALHIDARTRGPVEKALNAELDGSESDDQVRNRVRKIMQRAERCR